MHIEFNMSYMEGLRTPANIPDPCAAGVRPPARFVQRTWEAPSAGPESSESSECETETGFQRHYRLSLSVPVN
jgi:hypothetical protein